MNEEQTEQATDFGFDEVPESEKAQRVAGVFTSVAPRYDVMNDVMSAGLHRLWKRFAIGQAAVREGMKVLDIAGGTGDLARSFARKVGPKGEVWLTDINAAMLQAGRDRLLDEGLDVAVAQCDAEQLPFADHYFDVVTVAFGLRNMTHKDRALAQMQRVLVPGGRLLVLEFSQVWAPLTPLYDAYSFNVLPWLGQRIAGDADSYRYLAESIRRFPSQRELAAMMEAAGFERVEWFNLTAGVCALHVGEKF
ncbi:MAG TPA: bifunctional demethylmenaquinone methyltransferase/2-methoxy-6-polyprenyl-1,4-benzoquinol methylase UbiE [Burkholderiaceae bacterium]|nr:bifunctional demethylmenaquinone methyltransferase/2-methoxy-6-polyprenyl-1,4-benzoquinol methylase UbiE [Burkholderiaceae bacterium]